MEVVQVNFSSLNLSQDILMRYAVYWVAVLPAVLKSNFDLKYTRISSHLPDCIVLIIDAFYIVFERL